MSSIAVLGGNGFLGRKICEIGVRQGWSVTSLSRSGAAPKALSHMDNSWISKVNWEKANLLEPESYREKLAGKTAVVHSVGILFEDLDYKSSINLNFSFLNDVQKLANSLKGSNPMARKPSNTYGAIQRDLAVILADSFLDVSQKEGASEKIPAFVYISADAKPPIVPDEYLSTKREAEFELSCKKGLRAIFMRPNFMYDANEPVMNNRKILSRFIDLGYNVKNILFSDKIAPLNDLIRPPVSTETVALKLYEKLGDANFQGVVSLEEILKKSS
ncbi:NAD(P)-binding protein [Metschnikowia bicuspidata var. bicuspidata NRRL YB-4993]|uniref:NAD(P)-binding protein n=1 Tax=Metschnikowia bicuspidata var. bicuspidata NRRL YB-4993 TaxID=869754 RepID=A0A1A0HAZ4_9ASCO|nr:NAD(P)-binding protein [Metschnikowia bicuspidata var. bicuspidata NRRL YB-4993]OBA21181.1 NAD(P)-binding protein [Metschnikowia bicuspidata var. bicuspidata NRRL YB-4993]